MALVRMRNRHLVPNFWQCIVHGVLLAGLGFPVFSRSVYRYLATGNTDEVIQNMTLDDCSLPVRNFIEKVRLGFKNCGYVKKDNLVYQLS